MPGEDGTKFELSFSVEWERDATPLAECCRPVGTRGAPGVYYLFLTPEGRDAVTSPYDPRVFYIGKSNRCVAARAVKHFQSVTASVLANGKQASRPGRNLARYARDVLKNSPEGVYLRRGIVDSDYVGCAEEFLLRNYAKKHGHLPQANTQDFGARSAHGTQRHGREPRAARPKSREEERIRFAEQLGGTLPAGIFLTTRKRGVLVAKRENRVRLEMTFLKADVKFRVKLTASEPLTEAGNRSRTEALNYALELLSKLRD